MELRALVLSGFGFNCEAESKFAVEKAGGKADIVHINKIIDNPAQLQNYNLLYIPGGFSFGDDLGSGKVVANKLRYKVSDHLLDFIKENKLVLGVCNGFQILVKLGLLPVPDFNQRITITNNTSGRFEDRWVYLKTNPQSPCIFTKNTDMLMLPVRHGEGRVLAHEQELHRITAENLHTLQYTDASGKLAGYPYNPNGSMLNIAGLCDPSGRILGMMPHPEAFHSVENHPSWTFGNVREAQGLRFFKNALEYLAPL
ncbi:MAG TPA: phosphoribosylformylglycinamidine synthase subunit PurQ [Candidatus Bilamarchaeaceae archaeon]|nr:phosphoribosylformylglycinamidine synthase subunit PurQ [Candidatus Bilamarchaeaceae archaeon]